MKISFKKNVVNLCLVLLCSFIVTSCEKSTNTTTPTPTPTPTPANGSFSWTVNGGTTSITADSSFYRAQFKTIFVYKNISGVMKLQYEINLTAGTTATYALGASNVLTYTANTPYFVANAGNVIITSNSGTKVSGSFQATGQLTSGTSAVAGTFTDIPVQ